MRVELETVALEVEDHGEGVPVILLHGFPLSSQIWTPVRTAIEQAARLITPDLRGFGSSEKPRRVTASRTWRARSSVWPMRSRSTASSSAATRWAATSRSASRPLGLSAWLV